MIVMHTVSQTLIMAVSLSFCSFTESNDPVTDAAASIAQARRLIDARDYASASTLLEDLLPASDPADTSAILDLLRKSYEALAREAKAAGREREEARFQENLAIIAKLPAKAAPAKTIADKPLKPLAQKISMPATKLSGPTEPMAALNPSPNVATSGSAHDSGRLTTPKPAALVKPTMDPTPEYLPPLPAVFLAGPGSGNAGTIGKPSLPSPGKRGRPVVTSGTALHTAGADPSNHQSLSGDRETPESTDDSKPATFKTILAEGDRLFLAGKYVDAERCYAKLAFMAHLPGDRLGHWAYCRMVEVARKTNSRPKSGREWDQIEAEIAGVQKLTPNVWYEEWLRKAVADVRRNGHRPLAKPEDLVVHMPAPDQIPTGPEITSKHRHRLFGTSRTDDNTPMAAALATPRGQRTLNLLAELSEPQTLPALGAGAATVAPMTANRPGARAEPVRDTAVIRTSTDSTGTEWQVHETVNFRIHHHNARLADVAGQAAEAARAIQAKHWASPVATRPWTPACDIYLYPSGKAFALGTKQPEDSPGFSTMQTDGNRIIARRVNLRADHPRLLTATLPHEVTHVVLADLFIDRPVPLWANEGMAVLSEPGAEQQMRAAELEKPLESGRVLEVGKLMAMDHPDAADWSLYYAQSISVTRFLVEQAAPAQFIQFVRASQQDGLESALRGIYHIAGLADLQKRWTEYARQQAKPVKAASRAPRF
jgi:hypothetical protein